MSGSDRLVTAARDALARAMALYSNFRVGAALETADGEIFAGCNIENASYGLTMCAERVALFKALSDGAREFTALVVATESSTPTPPCGACRQVLWEFCGDIQIHLVNLTDILAEHRLAALLPSPFGDDQFKRS